MRTERRNLHPQGAGRWRFGRGVELLSIRTLRGEMAMSGQFRLTVGGQMQLAAHTQSTGLDNSSYVSAIKEAKTAETRQRRIANTVSALRAGRS